MYASKLYTEGRKSRGEVGKVDMHAGRRGWKLFFRRGLSIGGTAFFLSKTFSQGKVTSAFPDFASIGIGRRLTFVDKGGSFQRTAEF